MKKTFAIGILAASLVVGGGTSIIVAQAKENSAPSAKAIQEQMMDSAQMNKMMESGNMGDMSKMMEDGVMNFGQMKGHMKQMHPDLSDQQLEEHNKSMHGTGGASKSKNFQ